MRQKNDTWRSRTHPVKEDMAFQRASWSAQRVGWAALWLIVILALLGLFSSGPLSTATVESPGGDLRITYDRFHRNGAPATLALEAAPQQGGDVVIRMAGEMPDAFLIERIMPRPTEERGVAGGIELRFPVSAGEPLTVYLTLRPRGIGPVTSEIGIGERPPARLNQFIYP